MFRTISLSLQTLNLKIARNKQLWMNLLLINMTISHDFVTISSCNVAFSYNYNYNFNFISYFKIHLTITSSVFVSQAKKRLLYWSVKVKDLCFGWSPPHLRAIHLESSQNANRSRVTPWSLTVYKQAIKEMRVLGGGDSLREIRNHVTHSGLAGDDSPQGAVVNNKNGEGYCDIRHVARSLQLARTSRSLTIKELNHV